ncbi:MAG: molybdate ABC transporter substrate-binding protein [Maritimibacter sp.]
MTRHHLIAGLTAAALLTPSLALADDVLVFAAASLKDAMEEVAVGFEAETGNTATISLAGSSALARQIEQGAPADVYISANTGWVDQLESEGLLASGTRRDLLGNALVLIAHDPAAEPVDISPDLNLAGLLEGDHLAMALVEAVPAGIYGKAALEHLGLWQSVADHVAQADNVRAALALVSTGAAGFGVVYATDALADPGVTTIGTFPADSHPSITYPAAALEGHDDAATQAFLTYLTGPAARAVFEKLGFTVLGDE